jgi:hypothetical protein
MKLLPVNRELPENLRNMPLFVRQDLFRRYYTALLEEALCSTPSVCSYALQDIPELVEAPLRAKSIFSPATTAKLAKVREAFGFPQGAGRFLEWLRGIHPDDLAEKAGKDLL